MSWTYVELCCGSASIALALLGAKRPLLPYQGSKWRYRQILLDRFQKMGFVGAPRAVDVYDIGPWGTAVQCVLDPPNRAGVLDALRFMERLDARTVYEALHQQPVPEDPVTYTAQFLYLQRLAYSGKAVGERDGMWSSPGFNTSSAYGLPGTERFGQVNPMIPSLIRVLESYQTLLRPEQIGGARTSSPSPPPRVSEPTLVYLDPPYAGSTGYPAGDLSREAVVDLALAWRSAGACVVVSEAEALPSLTSSGWSSARMDQRRADTSPFRGKQPEWITFADPSKTDVVSPGHA